MESLIFSKKLIGDFIELEKAVFDLWSDKETTLFLVPYISNDPVSSKFVEFLRGRLFSYRSDSLCLFIQIDNVDPTELADWLSIVKVPVIVSYDYGRVQNHIYTDSNFEQINLFMSEAESKSNSEDMGKYTEPDPLKLLNIFKFLGVICG